MSQQVRTGISFRPTAPGIVPEIEERFAAKNSGYTWSEYCGLTRIERIDTVAFHRLERLIDIHGADAVHADAERKRRRRDRANTNGRR